MKRKTTKLSRLPELAIDYAPMPTDSSSCSANHASIPTAWERNVSPPGWHCTVCHPLIGARAMAEVIGET
jgi:hypothetical protein